MIHAQTNGSIGSSQSPKVDFDAQFNLIRTLVITGFGLFAGAVLGGVTGLFVYANSRNPSAHDGVFVVIQAVGVLVGLALGFLAAKGTEAQERLIEVSARAGVALLKKYRSRPGTAAHGNVGQRNIGQTTLGDDYLRQLLSNLPKPQ